MGISSIHETKRILKNAATDHQAVDGGIFGVQGDSARAVGDVAIDDESGVGAEFGAQREDVWNDFIVSGDFTHFLFGAQVYGKRGGMRGK